ncbi:MAG TPA: HEAT repeat domain-containing protein [Phycisphaerales bacterium]|nr:HEAT repeat domain-containing protein [Phycisphaerales bacterium]HRQ75648.1 HEAT repeat domain-containing protein [Phycisphaerales bacterium]
MMNRFSAVVACAGLALWLGGCEQGGKQSGLGMGEWSTKEQSVIGGRGSNLSGGVTLGASATPPLTVDPGARSSPELRRAAIGLLEQAAESTNALLRAHAIEALHHAPREVMEPIVRRGLGDPNRGVRFVAAMTVGRFKLTETAALLVPLLRDESPSVQAAAIFALRKCGEQVDLTPLATMIQSGDMEVKANVAMILGELGNPSAVPLLRSAAGQGSGRVAPARVKITDLQIAEAMVRLGNERQMEVIRAALFAPAAEQGELVALACQIVGKLRDERAAPTLLDFATREGRMQLPAEIRMAATRALAEIDFGQAPVDVPLSYVAHQDFQLRAQAAMTLGAIPGQSAGAALTRLLTDDNPLVQVHAAGGILQSTAPERLSQW